MLFYIVDTIRPPLRFLPEHRPRCDELALDIHRLGIAGGTCLRKLSINAPLNRHIVIPASPSSAHSARFGVASETLSHAEEGTALQITSNRSVIRANPIDTMCAFAFSRRFQLMRFSLRSFRC